MDSSLTKIASIASDTRPEAVPAARKGGAEQAQAKPREADSARPAETADTDRVLAAIEKINDYIQVTRRDLQFSLHQETGMTVVTVVDSDTQEVIRQIPAEEVLSLAEHLEEARGLLFRAKV